MMRKLKRWLRRWVFGTAGELPKFYAVISVGPLYVVHETTQSIHRARGMARERRARYEQTGIPQKVLVAEYYAEEATDQY